MKKRYYAVAIMALLLSSVVFAAGQGKIDRGTIQVVIDGDIVTVMLSDQNGELKTAQFDKSDFRRCKKSIGDQKLDDLVINSELIIEGDKIIIDGEEFSCTEVEDLRFSGKFDSDISFKAHLPYDEFDFGPKREVEVERDSDNDRFGFGDLIIEAGETVYGDVVAVTGDVEIYGEVIGDVVSVFGDIEIYDGAETGGEVIAPFGQVIERGSVDFKIGGKRIVKNIRYHNTADFDFNARYNRVEGLTLLSGIRYSDNYNELPDFNFDFGYAFALKRWDLDAGFRQNFGDRWTFYFGANLFQGAVTPDEWMFTYEENTTASLLFKEDFHDFYYRKGIKGFIGQEIGRYAHVRAEFYAQKNETLTKNTNKALFGGKKIFRENYSIIGDDEEILSSIDGDRRMLALSFVWDNRDCVDWPRSGQFLELKFESAGDGLIGNLGGDQSFNMAQVSLANYLPLTRKQHLGIRLKGGHSDQDLPLDKWFFLGGIGSLRGYEYKEFAGNRYFLANLDYYFEFSSEFAVALFADMGKTGFSESGFNDADLKSDLGVGVIFDDAFRLDIAQRLDNTEADPVFSGRLMIHF